jgi:hypothetical protein
MRGLRRNRLLIPVPILTVVIDSILNSCCLVSSAIALGTVVLDIAVCLVRVECALHISIPGTCATRFRRTYQERSIAASVSSVILLVHPETGRVAGHGPGASSGRLELRFDFDRLGRFNPAGVVGCIVVDGRRTCGKNSVVGLCERKFQQMHGRKRTAEWVLSAEAQQASMPTWVHLSREDRRAVQLLLLQSKQSLLSAADVRGTSWVEL